MNKKHYETKPEELTHVLVDNNEYFFTYDLGISSALISMNFKLISLDKENPKKVKFIFNREIGIEKAVDDYWTNHLELKARTFFENIKMLKNRIYSG